MTNTTNVPSIPRQLDVTFESGILTTGNFSDPRKVALRIVVPGVGSLGLTLTGDEVLRLLSGATFTVPAALRSETTD